MENAFSRRFDRHLQRHDRLVTTSLSHSPWLIIITQKRRTKRPKMSRCVPKATLRSPTTTQLRPTLRRRARRGPRPRSDFSPDCHRGGALPFHIAFYRLTNPRNKSALKIPLLT